MEHRWGEWYNEWFDLLANYYIRCGPLVIFDLGIINPNFPETEELNYRNFMRLWRQTEGPERGSAGSHLDKSSLDRDFDVLNHPWQGLPNKLRQSYEMVVEIVNDGDR